MTTFKINTDYITRDTDMLKMINLHKIYLKEKNSNERYTTRLYKSCDFISIFASNTLEIYKNLMDKEDNLDASDGKQVSHIETSSMYVNLEKHNQSTPTFDYYLLSNPKTISNNLLILNEGQKNYDYFLKTKWNIHFSTKDRDFKYGPFSIAIVNLLIKDNERINDKGLYRILIEDINSNVFYPFENITEIIKSNKLLSRKSYTELDFEILKKLNEENRVLTNLIKFDEINLCKIPVKDILIHDSNRILSETSTVGSKNTSTFNIPADLEKLFK